MDGPCNYKSRSAILKMATRDAMLYLVGPILPHDPKKIDGEDHANIC
jgi:hypothetical protein